MNEQSAPIRILFISISGNTRAFVKKMTEYAQKNRQSDSKEPGAVLSNERLPPEHRKQTEKQEHCRRGASQAFSVVTECRGHQQGQHEALQYHAPISQRRRGRIVGSVLLLQIRAGKHRPDHGRGAAARSCPPKT